MRVIRGIGLQPRQCLVVQRFSGAPITVIFYNEVVGSVHLQLGSSVFCLRCSQFFAAINDGSLHWGTLPLVQGTGNRYSTGVTVQHKFAFRVRLRQSSRRDQSFLDFVEGLLLFSPPHESGVRPVMGCRGATSFTCQGMNSQ